MGRSVRMGLVGVGLVAGLVLVACGSDEPASEDTAPTTTVPADGDTTASLERPDALIGTAQLDIYAHGVAFADGSVWVSSHHGRQVLRIDPETSEVLVRIETGDGPGPLRADGDVLWVADYGSSASTTDLARIDPATNTVAAIVEPGDVCCELELAHGSLWSVSPDGTLSRVDLATNAVVATVSLGPIEIGSFAATEDAVWVSTDDTTVVRVDPTTNTVVDEVAVDGFVVGAWGGLVRGVGTHAVWAIDPTTNKVVDEVELPDAVSELGPMGAIDAGVVYMSASMGERGWKWIVAIDLESGEVTGAVKTGFSPERVAAGGGGVWATDETGSLAHIDARALTGG